MVAYPCCLLIHIDPVMLSQNGISLQLQGGGENAQLSSFSLIDFLFTFFHLSPLLPLLSSSLLFVRPSLSLALSGVQ